MNSGIDKFMQIYAGELQRARRERPDEYAWPESELEAVLDRMKVAIVRGSYNHNSPAFRRTCRILGIPFTRTAINAFVLS